MTTRVMKIEPRLHSDMAQVKMAKMVSDMPE